MRIEDEHQEQDQYGDEGKDQDQDQKDAQPGGVSSSKGFAIGRLVRRRRRSIQQDLEIKIFSFSPNVLF